MPTLAEIVDAVWSTEIQPGLTAREILAAWLLYQESADGASSWNKWLQIDFPVGRPRHYHSRFAWRPPETRPAASETPDRHPQRTRRPATPSAPPSSSDTRASDRFAFREPGGGLVPRGVPPLDDGARTRDDEEALILALLMADD